MERKVPFEVKEIYHLYTRGVEKRTVFESTVDYERLQLLLYLCNCRDPVNIRTIYSRYKGLPFVKILERESRGAALVDILAYALMPNHFHLLVEEKVYGGISRFMLKLMTAYSMYFNTKYQRSGPLFTRPFRSQHVHNDAYLLWVYSYIVLNPLSLFQNDWKTEIKDPEDAHAFLREYPYGSFADLAGIRVASKILAPREQFASMKFDALLEEFTKGFPL